MFPQKILYPPFSQQGSLDGFHYSCNTSESSLLPRLETYLQLPAVIPSPDVLRETTLGSVAADPDVREASFRLSRCAERMLGVGLRTGFGMNMR